MNKNYQKVTVSMSDHPRANKWGQTYSGWVYLAIFGDIAKIGKTKNPKQRLTELQIKQKARMDDFHLITCDVCEIAEGSMHNMFRRFSIGHEWFRLGTEQIEHIKRIRSYKNFEFSELEYTERS